MIVVSVKRVRSHIPDPRQGIKGTVVQHRGALEPLESLQIGGLYGISGFGAIEGSVPRFEFENSVGGAELAP